MKCGFILDYDSIAARLALEDDNIQSKFLKTFLKELRSSCETEYNTGMQLINIGSKLTDKEKELVGTISFKEE